MNARLRRLGILLGAAAAAGAIVVMRHGRGAGTRIVPGGILVRDVALYDALGHRLLLGSFFERIAADVVEVATGGTRVLDVGCGPGRLSILLAREYGLDVTGLDLDPAMIERARAHVALFDGNGAREPSFLVGDVASMPFPDGSFDLVVSTLSMHHWADPTAALAQIARVLRPAGRALVWDLRPGPAMLHRYMPDPVERARGSTLHVVSATPWRWPWRFTLTERIELTPGAGGGR